jgi:hypothetical protein
MAHPDDRAFPAALTEAHEGGFHFGDGGEGVDFEPYEDFLAEDWTTIWFRAWTGNKEASGAEFLVFGQDGSGGYAAFWRIRRGQPLVEQPVVFLGSEGEMGVVARNLADYLWLLADGSGPYEAVMEPDRRPVPDARRVAVAQRYAPHARKSAVQVISAAGAEFPDFVRNVEALCR